MKQLSVVIITYNEQQNIQACLDSVRWADEIVVVDCFSTDDTVKACLEYTQKVFQRPWPGYGMQKNFGIEQATYEWILILDADERITEMLRDEIKEMMSQENMESVGYHIPRRNFWYGKWIRWAGMYPDYQLRLFKKSAGRYNDVAVHENLILNGPTAHLNNSMDHFTERLVSDHFKKFSRYTSYAAVEKAKARKNVFWTDLIFNHIATFLKSFCVRQGFREGVHGVIIGVFAAMYTFVKYAKLWEMKHRRKI